MSGPMMAVTNPPATPMIVVLASVVDTVAAGEPDAETTEVAGNVLPGSNGVDVLTPENEA